MIEKRSPFSRKLGTFIDLSEAELNILTSLHGRRKSYTARAEMVYQGQLDQQAFVLAEGWACSYRLLQSGERQIVDFQIPGDFLGLRSVLFHLAGQCIEPITEVQASLFNANDLMDVFTRNPRLGRAVLWAASRDDSMVIEHLVGMGRRNAVERTAHLLLELGARLMLVGRGTKAGYDCPLSQYQLADVLGLSAVHVNRVLRELREEKLVTFRSGRVDITNYDGLITLANFDHDYLDHYRPFTKQAHLLDRYTS